MRKYFRKYKDSTIDDLIKLADNRGRIDALKMLDFLVENNIEIPRRVYKNKLKKLGYEVI